MRLEEREFMTLRIGLRIQCQCLMCNDPSCYLDHMLEEHEAELEDMKLKRYEPAAFGIVSWEDVTKDSVKQDNLTKISADLNVFGQKWRRDQNIEEINAVNGVRKIFQADIAKIFLFKFLCATWFR